MINRLLSRNNMLIVSEYIVVIVSVLFSGSLIPYSLKVSYSTGLISFLTILIFVLYIRNASIKVSARALLFLVYLVIFLIALMFFKLDIFYSKEYFGMIIRLAIAFLVVTIIDVNNFVNKYINVMFGIALLSLVFYVFGLLFPKFIYSLPIIKDDVGTIFRNANIYFYQGFEIWNRRNAGIFWEPGAFQVFLNLAVIFEVYLKKGSTSWYKVAIIVTVLLSTISTVGYVVMFLLLGYKLVRSKASIKYPFIIISIVGLMFSGILNNVIFSKFSLGSVSMMDRLAGVRADISIFMNKPIFGGGFEFYNENFRIFALKFGAIAPNSSNSFTVLLAVNGLIYFSMIFVPFFSFFIRKLKGIFETLLIISVLVMLLSTQGLILKLLFLIIVFYGITPEAYKIPNSEGNYESES